MSAPYHTQGCSKTDCRCLQDHLDWEAECADPPASDLVGYLFAILIVYAAIVWLFWGDAIVSFMRS